MAKYDYRCPVCGKEREEEHSIHKNPRIKCECGKLMQRQLSAPVVKFVCEMPTPQGRKR